MTTVVDTNKNAIFSWGKGTTGCLGHDIDEDIETPMPLTLSIEEDIKAIVTGKDHVFALNEEKN